MPPSGKRLSEQELATIKAWIEAGADWPDDGSKAIDPKIVVVVPADQEAAVSRKAWQNPDRWIPYRRQAQGTRTQADAARRQANADSPAVVRSHRIAADAGGGRRLPRRPIARRLRETRRSLARLAAVRRALGAALARRRSLRRNARLRQGQAAAQRLAVPRLRHPQLQRRQAVRPLRRRSRSRAIAFSRHSPTASRRLGFFRAGPWDFIGHVELPETKIDGKIARHLDRDDMVANTIEHVRRRHRPVRPVPQPQVRSDLAGGLLPPAGGLRRGRPHRQAVRPRSVAAVIAVRNCNDRTERAVANRTSLEVESRPTS